MKINKIENNEKKVVNNFEDIPYKDYSATSHMKNMICLVTVSLNK